MNALLFHPDQELLLIRQQKYIFRTLNEDSVRFYPFYPVYCPLSAAVFQNHSPAELKKLISSVSIKNCIIEENALLFPAEIQLCDGNTASERIIIGTQKAGGEVEPDAEFLRFSMECRIFRIARIEINGFTTEFYDTVWVKNRT